MIDQFAEFLASSKNSEKLSPELRQAIYVRTGLEEPVMRAVLEGRDVVITGSAGGGKTHLIDHVSSRLRDEHNVTFRDWRDAESGGRSVLVIRDLGEVPVPVRQTILTTRDHLQSMIVAANEGTISTAPSLAPALTLLHEIQQGRQVDVPDAPVVVDLAGANLFESALHSLLNLDLVNQYIDQSYCCRSPETCPRRATWEQLREPLVSERLIQFLSEAFWNAEVKFRDLWGLVSDMLTGGDCAARMPTSAWFWRVFFGQHPLANTLRASYPPEYIVLPGDDSRLYYGDWLALDGRTLEDVTFIPLGDDPVGAGTAEQAQQMMNWLRLQFAFLGNDDGALARTRSGEADRIAEALADGRTDLLVTGLNRYLRYSLTDVVTSQWLELWGDLSIDRTKEKRPRASFGLGRIPRGDLRVARSSVIGNLAGEERFGTRLYLQGPGGETLWIDERLLRALGRGRPFRMSDRTQDEVQWAIWEFYGSLAAHQDGHQATLDVFTATKGFDQLTSRSWTIDREAGQIEAVL